MASPSDKIGRTILEELFPQKPSKSQNRQLQIVEEAIRLYSRNGIESVRHADIAKACGVSRTLVQHYFPQPEDLAIVAIQYIRGRFQNFCIEAVRKKETPRKRLLAYLEATYDWLKARPADAKVWLLFYYYCGLRKKYRTMNTELVRQGTERIQAMIEAGVALGEFQPSPDLPLRAKLFQNILTGGLLAHLTEDESALNTHTKEATLQLCMKLADGSWTSGIPL